jgi:hypothetical protein
LLQACSTLYAALSAPAEEWGEWGSPNPARSRCVRCRDLHRATSAASAPTSSPSVASLYSCCLSELQLQPRLRPISGLLQWLLSIPIPCVLVDGGSQTIADVRNMCKE